MARKKKKKQAKTEEISAEDLGIVPDAQNQKNSTASSKLNGKGENIEVNHGETEAGSSKKDKKGSKKGVKKSTKKSTKSSKSSKSSKKSTKKSTKTVKKKSSKKSAKKSTKKSTKKSVKKTSKKTTKKSNTSSSTSSKKKRSNISDSDNFHQSETNVGMVGHVDHGKTTLVRALSGIWTERYSDEVNRGITIKLGYAETEIMECPSCNKIYTYNLANLLRKSKKDPKGHCPECGAALEFKRRISFVDAPGHEILMATMLSGASLMDGAVLLIAANEECPQPQTREHLAALEIAKIENIIIVQNKVDAVGKERAYENYKQIKRFIKGTIAENAPIIPVSAVFNANVDIVAEMIEKHIPTPEFDEDADFLFTIARSFDVNRPGSEIRKLHGGVIGGSIVSGKINVGEDVEIRPGFKIGNKYHPVTTKVASIYEGTHPLQSAKPGGLIALGTLLDPAMTRSDQLIGHVVGTPDTLPPVIDKCKIEVHLLEQVLGAEEIIKVEPIKKQELLMVVISTMTSAGIVTNIGKKHVVSMNLKRPICAIPGSIVAISRRIKGRFRLIGYGYLLE